MNSDEELRTLEYRSPDLNPRPTSGWQITGGVILAPFATYGSMLLGGFVAFAAESGSEAIIALGALLGGLTALGFIAWLAVAAGRYEVWRGLAMGLWIGMGLVILVAGACFAAGWR